MRSEYFIYITSGQGQTIRGVRLFYIHYLTAGTDKSVRSEYFIYITSGQGQTNLLGQNILYTLPHGRGRQIRGVRIFNIYYLRAGADKSVGSEYIIYITSGQGQTNPWGQNIYTNRDINLLSLWSIITETSPYKSDPRFPPNI